MTHKIVKQFLLEFKMLNDHAIEPYCLRKRPNEMWELDLGSVAWEELVLPKTLSSKIVKLRLQNCYLDSIPSSLSYLSSLRSLQLGNNNISDMSPLFSMPFTENLEVLDVSSNELTTIEGISAMHSLNKLDISNNIPLARDSLDELEFLLNLQTLHAYGVNFRGIVPAIYRIPKLKNLELKGTELYFLSEQKRNEEKKKLRGLRKRGCKIQALASPRVLQVYLIGAKGAGKSTMVNALRHSINLSSTTSISGSLYTIPLQYKGEEFNLEVWEIPESMQYTTINAFGSQLLNDPLARSMWMENYLESAAILFMCDISNKESLGMIKYLTNLVLTITDNQMGPTIFMANKADLRGTREEILSKKDMQEFVDKLSEQVGWKVPFYYNSFTGNTTMEKVIHHLLRQVLERWIR